MDIRHAVRAVRADGTVEARDDAARDGAGELLAARVADGDDPLAHAQVIAVAELGGHVACAVDFEHGEVGGFIEPDDDGVVKFTVIRFDLHGNGLGV